MNKNEWNGRYSKKGFAYGLEPNKFLTTISSRLKTSAKAIALSIAEGEGKNAVFLASLGYEVECIEFSKIAVEKIKFLSRKNNCEKLIYVKTQDVLEFNFKRTKYDLIPTTRKNKYLFQNIMFSLKPGGLFVFQGYHVDYKGRNGPQAVQRRTTCIKIKDLLRSFDVLVEEENEEEFEEGIYRKGKSKTVKLLMRKPVNNVPGIKMKKPSFQVLRTKMVKKVETINDQNIQSLEREQDLYLSMAPFLLKSSLSYIEKLDRCFVCWFPRSFCTCRQFKQLPIVEFERHELEILVLTHPNEFLRSTSSARVLPFVLEKCRICFFGIESDLNILKWKLECIDLDSIFILYPVEGSEVLSCSFKGDNQSKVKLMLVLDGTWKQTSQLLKFVFSIREELKTRCFKLNEKFLKKYFSPVINMVHDGYGLGRISTFEATFFALSILNNINLSTDLLFSFCIESLGPLLIGLSKSRFLTQDHLLKNSDASVAPTYCSLCNLTVSSPSRYKAHIKGSKHTLTSNNVTQTYKITESLSEKFLFSQVLTSEPADCAIEDLKSFVVVK
eukprot:snap_masked-scaffold_15-processed-gene-1.27-mRNA-1 protein AED:1.00 eAED:1.00 QI:0/0/0/0/1/1/2/0/555